MPGDDEHRGSGVLAAKSVTGGGLYTVGIDEISPWLGQQILEIGCGIGTYATELAVGSRKITAIGMERTSVDEAVRRLARHPNVRLICGDATAADTPKSHD
jgi:16S rRNA A1518/A1519 N6-dimethyltransferase RsmA/KsgA/DIM1 with predicted DNA glycosylase/AP lyase activity